MRGALNGSVFGPFLFFLYVNDLSNYARHFSSIEQVFADYINLLIEHGNINALFNIANEELLKMKNWFFSNALLSNIRKTKFILFYRKSKLHDSLSCFSKLETNSHSKERLLSIKYLGKEKQFLKKKCITFIVFVFMTFQSKGIPVSKIMSKTYISV